MKKITKAGVYLSLAAMLALGTGTAVLAYSDENYWGEDVYTADEDYTITDSQGIVYYADRTSSDITYGVYDFTQSYDKNHKAMVTKLDIANRIGGTPVTSIDKGFKGQKEIEEITMGNNIWDLSGSFMGCTGLKRIKLSSAIKEIPARSFQDCSSLKAIQIPKACKELGTSAFEGCSSLQKVTFAKTPASFKVGKNAFKGTAWKKACKTDFKPMIAGGVLLDASTDGNGENMTIKGSKVSCIAQNSLANARSVKNLTISKVKNIQSHSLDGCKAKKITILQPKKLGDKMFANTKNVKKIVITGNVKITKTTMKSLKNPKKVTLYVEQKRVAQLQKILPCKVRAIASKKTAKGSLLTDKKSVKNSKVQSKKMTGEGVIVNKSLDGKMIEDNQGLVYEMDKNGYYYITKFDQKYDEKFNPLHTEITIPEKINDIDVLGVKSQDVFQYCTEITSVAMPENIKLPRAAFMGCTNLKKVTYLSVDGLSVFYRAKLRNYLFKDCTNLEEVTLTECFELVGNYAFMNCTSLKKITFPKNVDAIGAYAFYNTGLEEVILDSKSVTGIDTKAFANCKKLRCVTIRVLDAICSHAFYNCTNLEKITIKGFSIQDCTIESNAFVNTKWIETYKRKNQPVILNGVLVNGYYVKGNVTLDGKKVKRILGNSFADNHKIKKLKVKGVDEIDDYAFVGSSATEASISGCKKMGMYLFGDCKKLKKISIEKIKTIPMYSLALVTGLQKLTLGKDVEKLEASAVHHCPNLRTVSFKTQKPIDWSYDTMGGTEGNMFVGCTKLRDVYMNSKSLLKGSEDSWMDAFDKKKVTIHVPKKLYQKYEDSPYIYCKVVAKK